MINYQFKSVEDIAQRLRWKRSQGLLGEKGVIGFTLDTPEDVNGENWEPTEWYGIALTKIFGAESIVIGEYGIGILWHDPIENEGIYIEQSLIAFIKDEQNIDVDEDYMMAIDMEDWK